MQASRDQNNIPTLLGGLDSDGKTPIRVKVDPTSHALAVSDGTSGSDNGPVNAPRDENDVPVLMGVSSADGVTPIPIYANAAGQLLIKST